jgi:hypothetical protein
LQENLSLCVTFTPQASVQVANKFTKPIKSSCFIYFCKGMVNLDICSLVLAFVYGATPGPNAAAIKAAAPEATSEAALTVTLCPTSLAKPTQ